jgi:hypothetical protein
MGFVHPSPRTGKTRERPLPSVEVNTQLVDVWCNVPAPGVGCQGRLLEAEEGGREGGDSLLLELAAGLEAFPGGRDLDADAAADEVRCELLEVRGYPWRWSVRLGVKRELLRPLTLGIFDDLRR